MAREEKAKLCIEVAEREECFVNKEEKNISIYVGMPFCPTRCLYCSFAANPIAGCKKDFKPYLEALSKEISAISEYVLRSILLLEYVLVSLDILFHNYLRT